MQFIDGKIQAAYRKIGAAWAWIVGCSKDGKTYNRASRDLGRAIDLVRSDFANDKPASISVRQCPES